MFTRDELYTYLKEDVKVLSTEGFEGAFKSVDRVDFINVDYEYEAYEDYALPLSGDSFVLKPSVAAFMLELVGVKNGDRVLEIGSGSGYLTALISCIVGQDGSVTTFETSPDLVKLSRSNLAKYKFSDVDIREGNTAFPKVSEGLFSRIIATGALEEIPASFIKLLKSPGVLVLPVGQDIVRIEKDKAGKIS